MKSIAGALAALSCIIAGAAQAQGLKGVYLHDSAIGTQADSIDAAAQGASTLKPYDDQLANLTAFAAQEDLAVATQSVAARDFEIQQLVGQPYSSSQDERSLLLVAHACQRLTELIVLTNPCGAPSELKQATVNLASLNTLRLRLLTLQIPNAIQQTALAQVRINADIADFTRLFPDLTPPTCASVVSPPNPTEIKTLQGKLAAASDAATKLRLTKAIAELGGLATDCNTLADAQSGLATLEQVWITADIADFTRQYPELEPPTCATVAPPSKTDSAPSPTEIDALNARLAGSDVPARQRLGSAIAALTGLRDECDAQTAARAGNEGALFRAAGSIGKRVMDATDADHQTTAAAGDAALKPLSDQLAAVKKAGASETDVAKLQAIESELEGALKDADPVAKVFDLTHIDGELSQVATALACQDTSPACTTAPSGSLDAKTAAVLGVVNAAAQAADVSAGRADESHWIAAAQAIVAAYKADAQTVTAADSAMTAVVAQNEALAAQEAALLSESILLAAGDSKLVSDMVDCEGFLCALPAYVDSWNEGRAPAAVLAYREVQVYRAFNIQRQRQAAQAQRALLLAATATLKAYGDGGIQPQTIAQWVQALGIVAIAAK